MSKKLVISKAEATAFTIDGIGVELWWNAGTPGAYDKAVSTCRLLQKVPEMLEALKDLVERYPNSPWIIDRLKPLIKEIES